LLEPEARRYLVLLAVPFVVALFFLRPAQGIVRDFDDYSTGAMTVAVLVAARAGSRLREASHAGWLAMALALGCASPVMGWLALENDFTRGLARVESWLAGPPERSEDERAKTLDYIGGRWFRAERYDLAESALEKAVALAPSPRLVLGWASAAERARDYPTAERAYHLLYDRAGLMADSTSVRIRAIALGGLAVSAARRGDLASARQWAERAVRESPGDPGPAALLQKILGAQTDTTTH
jgi:tetratricopeptide (TPR) repeat protein